MRSVDNSALARWREMDSIHVLRKLADHIKEDPSFHPRSSHLTSFGQPITELPDLIEAISEFASRAAEKLRRQFGLTGRIQVFAHTSPFRPGPRFSKSVVVALMRPTADSRLLVQAAVSGVEQIYQPGYRLSKAGVMLLDLMPDSVAQGELDFEPEEAKDRSKLMMAMDSINDRFGRGTVHVGSAVGAGAPRDWSTRQERLTPQYTTKWSDLPVARA